MLNTQNNSRLQDLNLNHVQSSPSPENNNEISDNNRRGSIDLGRKKRIPFMDLLIQQHLADPSEFTELNIREEVDTFMFEGHDTTGWGLVWATYLLGLNPDAQEKVHQELDSVFGDDDMREFSMDDVKKLKYTEAVVKEAQRLYPSVPLLGRRTKEPTKIGPHLIPSGVDVSVLVPVLHRNEEQFEDPERFRPERFFPENCKGRNAYSFIPFSAGPRNCIGQKFALLEEKILLASLFRKFKVTSLDPRDLIQMSALMITKSSKAIRVKLELRNSTAK